MKIAVANTTCTVEGDQREMQALKKLLSYPVKGARYSKAFQDNRWDGTKSFVWKNRFPTGLLPLVTEAFPGVDVVDMRNHSPSGNNPIDLKGITLRDYQEEAVQCFLKNKRGIIRLSTRAGKTVIAIAITQMLGKKTLFVTHTKDLLKQSRNEFEQKLGCRAGQIGDGVFLPREITIGTIQTLSRGIKDKDETIKKFLSTVELVVFDEVHRASSSYQLISSWATNARWRLGLSATACMTDKENALSSQAMTGPIIYEIDMEKLIDEGRIARPLVYFVDIPNKTKITKWTDWKTVYREGVVEFHTRNLAVCIATMKLVRRGKPTLVLVESIDHGNILTDMLSSKVNVRFMSGSDDTEDRKAALVDLQTMGLDVLVSTRIFNEGVDIPRLEAVVVASGGKSPIQIYQKYGRGITKIPGKEETIVVDFIDRSHRKLYEHSQQRWNVISANPAFQVSKISITDL